MNEIFKRLTKTKNYLILTDILLVFFLILLNNLGVLPIQNFGHFFFFTFLLLIFALYRPGWSFLFFVGTIILENINVAPSELGIQIRPYQLIAAATILAVIIRWLAKRLNFDLPKLFWFDTLPIIFAFAGFFSALFASDKVLALRLSLIAATFAAIYFLGRIFVQNIEDFKNIIPFFLSSSLVIIVYGIWQNIAFMGGTRSFEIMPGRPNATFAEPDWYGLFLVFLLSGFFSLIYSLNSKFKIQNLKQWPNAHLLLFAGCWFLIVITLISLILTVSRSAWLGALVIGILYQAFIIKYFIIDNENWKGFLKQLAFLATAGMASVAFVYVFNLTSFQLFNRFQSTGTGLQKITVSCKADVILPEKVNYSEELIRFGCRHINLEEIAMEKMRGYYIKETYRTDPNINLRKDIYEKSWDQVRLNPLLGIGWGNIGNILGKDERGSDLNSSNIFPETWLGAGVIGLVTIAMIWLYVIINSIKIFLHNDQGGSILGLFLFLGSISLMIPNLFNAGIFLGMLWLFFGISVVNYEKIK